MQYCHHLITLIVGIVIQLQMWSNSFMAPYSISGLVQMTPLAPTHLLLFLRWEMENVFFLFGLSRKDLYLFPWDRVKTKYEGSPSLANTTLQSRLTKSLKTGEAESTSVVEKQRLPDFGVSLKVRNGNVSERKSFEQKGFKRLVFEILPKNSQPFGP